MNNISPKKGYGYIYKYTSPSGKSYIGQTVQSLAQRAGHSGKNYRDCPLFYQAIKKYGFQNFDVEILAMVPQEELDNAEIKYIEIFNTFNNGYNKTTGGQKNFTRKGKKVYQYNSQNGYFIREWENANEVARYFNAPLNILENCLLNKVFTQYGYCWSYLKMNKFPINERLVIPQEKSVKQYNLQGELLKTYKSIAEAAKINNYERSAIKRCCRHELKQAYGYYWECDEILLEKKYNNTAKPIEKIDPKNNEIIEVFPSISAAAKSLKKETSLIRRVLDKDNNTAYGFKWKTHSRFND